MRTFRVLVGGNEYEVAIEEITEQGTAAGAKPVAAERSSTGPVAQPVAPKPTAPAKKAAVTPKPTAGEGTIVAAMPGTILDVKVSQGDTVKRGDTLMILEAMKMENEIKAPCDGVVAVIDVAKGTAVNAGMALMVLT